MDLILPTPDVEAQEMAVFSSDDAKIIRQYKTVLRKYGLGASHWCRLCQTSGRDFWEIKIQASDTAIKFECPHGIITA